MKNHETTVEHEHRSDELDSEAVRCSAATARLSSKRFEMTQEHTGMTMSIAAAALRTL